MNFHHKSPPQKKTNNCVFIGNVSVHNDRIRSDGTGSGRKAFTVAQRFGSPSSFHQVQGECAMKPSCLREDSDRLYINIVQLD